MENATTSSRFAKLENDSIEIAVLQVGTLLLICVLGLLGNVCLCLTMFRRRQLQLKTSNWIVVHLAVSDLLRIVFSMSVSVGVLITREWIFGEIFCKINGFYTLLFLSGSLLSVTVISVNRYFLIVRPSRCKALFTETKTKLMIVGLWLLAVISALPPCFSWGHYGFYESRATYFVALGSSNSYTTVLVLTYIATPLSIMLGCYCKIFRAVRDSKKRVLGTTQTQSRATSVKEV